MLSTRRSRTPPPGLERAIAVITRWRRPDSRVMQVRISAAVSALGRIRRPAATTVSAASTRWPGKCTARALPRAIRTAYSRGDSSRAGVSSMSGETIWSGVTPICCSSINRRGLDEARTRGSGFSRGVRESLEAEGDPAFGQVIGCHLDIHPVAGQHADTVLAHLAAGVGKDGVLVVQFHAEHGIG